MALSPKVKHRKVQRGRIKKQREIVMSTLEI